LVTAVPQGAAFLFTCGDKSADELSKIRMFEKKNYEIEVTVSANHFIL
jgi:hypothetical protein